MQFLKQTFLFFKYTLHDAGSKLIYSGTVTGAATSQAIPADEVPNEPLLWLLPYVPLMAVVIAALKLTFDFYKWRIERDTRK
jgi:hypothetical protein